MMAKNDSGGAFAGLIASGLSAMAYALHFTDDSFPFVGV